MSEAGRPVNPDDFCYRHPDRRSYVLCQRCTRTVCPDCYTQAPVGVVCAECMREQQRQAPPAVRRAQRAAQAYRGKPYVTYGIIGIAVGAYLLNLIPGFPLFDYLAYNPFYMIPAPEAFQPWRLVTHMAAHGSILHLALNMLALWMLGQSLEPLLGHWRFATLFVLSGIGGAVLMGMLAPGSLLIGASGGIFGLFGALLIIGRHLGANVAGIAVVLGLNLVIGFIPGFHVAWQAHVGGLIIGAAIGFIYARTRSASQQRFQVLLLVGLAVLTVALAFVPYAIYR